MLLVMKQNSQRVQVSNFVLMCFLSSKAEVALAEKRKATHTKGSQTKKVKQEHGKKDYQNKGCHAIVSFTHFSFRNGR